MGQRSSTVWPSAALLLFGTTLLTVAPMFADPALASRLHHGHALHSQTADNKVISGRSKTALKTSKVRYVSSGVRLQCVSFARAASGIELKGNAANWWDAAARVYERGSRPEPGSVLNFRSNGHMRLGHVAVVMAVTGDRQIEIEHANWAGPGANKGGVSRNIPVIDVSAANDWSAVRVGHGQSEEYGSVYPTYGFIYDRADRGVMVANDQAGTPSPAVLAVDEVAQAAPRRHKQPLADPNILSDGPARTFR